MIGDSPPELVSVVIPIYNPGSYFSLAIDSILKQDYTNFEVIISDDSEERSSLIPADPRITYVRNESGTKGIFGNLNNALTIAKGTYLQIFCQDDLMGVGFLSQQVDCFRLADSVGMVFSDYVTLLEGAEVDTVMEQRSRHFLTRYYQGDFFRNKLLVKGCMPGNLSPVMLHRDVIKVIGYFDDTMKYCGDHQYWIRICDSFSAVYNGRRNLFIRVHKNQASKMLPKESYFSEDQINFERLSRINTIRKSPSVINWYINQRFGVPHLYAVFRLAVTTRSLRSFQLLRILNKYPFKLYRIVIMFFLTIRNKYDIIRIDEEFL
jgi:glycosyltransferase involved in cell wall biosynthesis